MCGLYIHIPFCVKKCNYCDFNSQGGGKALYEPYVKALKSEIERVNGQGMTFDTIYVGGGTPTVLPNYLLTDIIKSVKNKTKDCEITVECNPKTAYYEDFLSLRAAGVNRLSIGLQSSDDKELLLLGRIHTRADFEACLTEAREAGFDNISIDIMFGLPDQTLSGFKQTLEAAAAYNCEHISCYCLKIEEGTPFAKAKLNLPSDDNCADMYDFCVDFLKKQGYERYEISNFAKNEKISRHNTKYWLLEDYIGLGAGAHSCFKGRRFAKISNIRDYINEINRGSYAIAIDEKISESEKMSEFVFLGLRLARGIEENRFFDMFGKNIFDVFEKPLKKYINQGIIKKENGRIFIKPEFLYVSNTILSDFV